MNRKIADIVLFLLAGVGALLAWQSRQERSRLLARYEQLVQVTGDLPVADTSQVNVLALKTGEPLHFAWRIYLPPNYPHKLVRGKSGVQHTSWFSGSREFIARIRFRENEPGNLQVYANFTGGSRLMSLGSQPLAELLRHRWDKIRVDQLGATGLMVVRPARAALLLRLTLTEDMQREARKRLSAYEQEQFVPVLYELTLDSDASKP